MPDGKQIYAHEGGKLNIRLEDEVLTVNGRKYVIPKKDDSITVRNGRVEIDGQPATPAEE